MAPGNLASEHIVVINWKFRSTSAGELAAAAMPAESRDRVAHQRRLNTQSTPAIPQMLGPTAQAGSSGAEATAAPRKRLGRRLTTQSLDVPLSQLAAAASPGLGPAFGRSTPREPEPGNGHSNSSDFETRAPLRKLAPGGLREAEEAAAAGSGSGERRLLRGMQDPGGGNGDDTSLASRSVDTRAGRGGSVFAQQLASMRASTPSSLQSGDTRYKMV